MATLFTNIFDEFLQTEVSSITLSLYTPPQLSNYLSILLKRSREEFFQYALINPPSTIPKMQDCSEYWSEEYTFILTSATPTTTLNPIPVSGSLYYVTVDGVVVLNNNITYNSGTGNITISGMSNGSHSIDAIFYQNGQFNQTLSMEEIGIILDWMGVISQKNKIREEKLQALAIYGRDSQFGNQGNHIRELQKVFEYDRKSVIQRMLNYTHLSDPNKLSGMGVKG